MRLPKPPVQHPPEVYLAIVREHQDNPVRMAERLQSCGWTLADAAWAAVHWNLRTLAAAVANERATRGTSITTFSGVQLAKLRTEIDEAKQAPENDPDCPHHAQAHATATDEGLIRHLYPFEDA